MDLDEIWNEGIVAVRTRRGDRIEELLREIRDVSDSRRQGIQLYFQSALHSIASEFNKALQLAEEAIAVLPDSALQQRANARLLVAAMLSEIGESVASLNALGQVEEEFHALRDETGLAVVYTNRGRQVHAAGQTVEAMEWIHKAIEIHKKLGDTLSEAQEYMHLATIEHDLGNYEGSIALLHKVREMCHEESMTSLAAYTCMSIGAAYGDVQEYDKAISYSSEAIAMGEDLHDYRLIAMALVNRATAYHILNDLEASSADLSHARNVAPVHVPSLLWQLDVLEGEIREAETDYQSALDAYTRALKLAENWGVLTNRMLSHKAIAALGKKLKDFELYVAHNDAEQALKEQIRGSEMTRRLAFQEKQREIEQIENDRERERAVLYSTLPKHVADRVIKGEDVTDHFDDASVLFLDIVGFTTISDRIPPGHVVHLLKAIFKVCDDVCVQHGLTKVKTIGDSYMAVAGVPEPLADHAQRAARAAVEMIHELNDLRLTMDPSLGDTSWTEDVGEISVRIGLHCGPVVAGIVGEERLQYDVWGDTVNTASRMESTGEPGRIQCSEVFVESLTSYRDDAGARHPEEQSHEGPLFTTAERGAIEVKGKGSMTTYWLEGA